MQFGIVTFSTDQSIRPDDLARAMEDHGFDSLYLTEHSNIPASRETPYPGDGDLPDEYYRTYDPFVALTTAAMKTERLKIGTGMCTLIQRDPIHTAKAVATLDHLSGGRFLFGVGAGWNREEMVQHGTNPATRMRLLRERLLAIKELWENDVAEYHGEFVDIAPTSVRPRPLQRPHPPVIIGGMGPTVLERVLEYGDAWAPNPGWPPMDDLPQRINELRERGAANGRGHIPVAIFGMSEEGDQVERYSAMGVDECVFLLDALPDDDARRKLARIAEVAELGSR
jgi:probable F420-dependent oxidoreductase